MKRLLLSIIAVMMTASVSSANQEFAGYSEKTFPETYCMALNIYYEARGSSMADQIGVLENGKIAQIGSPEEIYNNPNSIYVANRLGSPKINIVKNSVLNTIISSDAFQFGLRPEHIKLGQGDLSASVKTVEALGAETVIELDYNGAEILCLYQGSFDGRRGEDIKFAIDQSKVLFFNEDGNKMV